MTHLECAPSPGEEQEAAIGGLPVEARHRGYLLVLVFVFKVLLIERGNLEMPKMVGHYVI